MEEPEGATACSTHKITPSWHIDDDGYDGRQLAVQRRGAV
jgi:hypothetical protein